MGTSTSPRLTSSLSSVGAVVLACLLCSLLQGPAVCLAENNPSREVPRSQEGLGAPSPRVTVTERAPSGLDSQRHNPLRGQPVERLLQLRNPSQYTIRIHLRWFTHQGGQKRWMPPGGEIATYTLRPGTGGVLYWGGAPVQAEKVRLWGESTSGAVYTGYQSRDLFLNRGEEAQQYVSVAAPRPFTVTLPR